MVDVDVDGTTEHYVLRIDTGTGPFSGTDYTLTREAAVYRALQGTDVPVPDLVAVNDEGTAFLMRRVDGYDSDSIADPDERASVADSYMKAIAALHQLDVDALELPGFRRPASPEDRFLLDLETWEQIYREKVTRPEPILAFALDWLRRHVPTTEDRTVLCWGDVGPGNFMYKDGAVAALLDWELAHLGDPMDDLAFHSLRTYLLFDGSFCDLRWSLERYEHYTGRKVDAERLEYLRIQCLVRWMLSALAALEFDSGPDMAGSTFLFLTTSVRKWLASLLAVAVGVDDITTVLPQPGPPSGRAEIIKILTSDLNTVVAPKVADDPIARQRVIGMNMLLSHLATADGLGTAIERDECADLAQLLGAVPETVEAGWAELQSRIGDGDVGGDQELAAYFVRSADRAGVQWPFIASFLAKRIEPIAP
jgi:aminoglycoside phosphotransferase (APT) family kinase protein